MSIYVLSLSHISWSHRIPLADQVWYHRWTVLLHVSFLPNFCLIGIPSTSGTNQSHRASYLENQGECSRIFIASVPKDLSLVLPPCSVCCTAPVIKHLQCTEDLFIVLLDVGHSLKSFSSTLHSQCSSWRLYVGGWHHCYDQHLVLFDTWWSFFRQGDPGWHHVLECHFILGL
jgi:hypothetical protein